MNAKELALEISTHGARLVAPGITTVGPGLQYQNCRALYKVVWIGQPHTALAGQVGVETLEPAQRDLGTRDQSAGPESVKQPAF